MSSMSDASTTIGTSMGQEICLILGQVSFNLLIGRKTSRRKHVVRGEIDEKAADIQARSSLARTLGENEKECQAEGEAKGGHMENFNSITHENCEASISLTLRTRSSRRPSRMLARNWQHIWLLVCFARHARRTRMERPVARLMISSLIFLYFWKPVNPPDCLWKDLHQIVMRTILQERETLYYSITNLVHKIYSYASNHEDMRNLKRFQRGT